MSRVTMKDVAREAQVSITTVSLVLNDAPGIAQATRERVRRIIQDLKYTPNDQARRLSSGRTGTVALVMPPWSAAFADPYFLELLRGTLEAVRDRGYELLLEISDDRFLQGHLWKRLYASQRVDGFLIATPHLDQEYLKELAHHRFPTMLINGDRPDLPEVDFVGYDDRRCGREATAYLIGLGHRRIAHIAGPPNHASSSGRFLGFQEAHTAAGLPLRPEDVAVGDYMPGAARVAVQSFLNRPKAQWPTALFCANDTMALAAMAQLHEQGLRVPQDISVIGVDDIGGASASRPGLTTYRQDIFTLAHRAADLFLGRLGSTEPTKPIRDTPPMVLVERGSCAPPTAPPSA